jgi:hypothetical protein
MIQSVTLKFRDLSVSPPRILTIKKDNLWQAIHACSEFRVHQEYIEIIDDTSGRIYGKNEITEMIKGLPNSIRQ